MLWSWLSRFWPGWRHALVLVRPETVIRWHRRGFGLYWRWKSRSRRPGRPTIEAELRDLILEMRRANPTWGAPRIHGELLKLGFTLAQSTVSKYLLKESETAVPELAHVPPKSSSGRDRHRLRCGVHGHLRAALRVRRSESRATQASPCPRNRPSDG